MLLNKVRCERSPVQERYDWDTEIITDVINLIPREILSVNADIKDLVITLDTIVHILNTLPVNLAKDDYRM